MRYTLQLPGEIKPDDLDQWIADCISRVITIKAYFINECRKISHAKFLGMNLSNKSKEFSEIGRLTIDLFDLESELKDLVKVRDTWKYMLDLDGVFGDKTFVNKHQTSFKLPMTKATDILKLSNKARECFNKGEWFMARGKFSEAKDIIRGLATPKSLAGRVAYKELLAAEIMSKGEKDIDDTLL